LSDKGGDYRTEILVESDLIHSTKTIQRQIIIGEKSREKVPTFYLYACGGRDTCLFYRGLRPNFDTSPTGNRHDRKNRRSSGGKNHHTDGGSY
jgi:hypothetical protein